MALIVCQVTFYVFYIAKSFNPHNIAHYYWSFSQMRKLWYKKSQLSQGLIDLEPASLDPETILLMTTQNHLPC